MKLIAGLGNIGDKYCFTRHNTGFMVLDKWALDEGFSFKEDKKLKSFIAKKGDIIFVKPTTFMNLSGEAVRAVMDYYKIDVKDVLIIYDDISLDLGKIRFRANGSDGGHNGIKSIINNLHTQQIPRLKIGIAHDRKMDTKDYVLGHFNSNDLAHFKEMVPTYINIIEDFISNDISYCMQKYNHK